MGQGIPWWSRDGKRPGPQRVPPRRPRRVASWVPQSVAPRVPPWVAGIRAHVGEATLRWEVDWPARQLASPTSMRWDDVFGVTLSRDDVEYPGVGVLRRGATSCDFLPLASAGVPTLLEGARKRGLVRTWVDLVVEMRRTARSAAAGG